MYVELVAQFVSHEIDNVKYVFTLHRTKHLGNNNFGQFNKFQEFLVEDDKCKKIAPNYSDQIELIVFSQNFFVLMQHAHLFIKKMEKITISTQ